MVRITAAEFRELVALKPRPDVDPQVCVRCCDPIGPGEPVADRGAGPQHEECP